MFGIRTQNGKFVKILRSEDVHVVDQEQLNGESASNESNDNVPQVQPMGNQLVKERTWKSRAAFVKWQMEEVKKIYKKIARERAEHVDEMEQRHRQEMNKLKRKVKRRGPRRASKASFSALEKKHAEERKDTEFWDSVNESGKFVHLRERLHTMGIDYCETCYKLVPPGVFSGPMPAQYCEKCATEAPIDWRDRV